MKLQLKRNNFRNRTPTNNLTNNNPTNNLTTTNDLQIIINYAVLLFWCNKFIYVQLIFL